MMKLLLLKCLYAPLNLPLSDAIKIQYMRIVRRILMLFTAPINIALPIGIEMPLVGREFIHRHLMFYKIWEPSLSLYIYDNLESNDLFCDVGANIGYFSCLAARKLEKLGSKGHVLAVEASPSIFAKLKSNTASMKNIYTKQLAAGDVDGEVEIFKSTENNEGLSSIYENQNESGMVLEAVVKMKTLTQMIAEQNLPVPRLVKIDVEGAEWPVIKGMEALLQDQTNALEVIVEFDEVRLKQFGISAEEFFTYFENFGFHSYDLNNLYLTPEYLPQTKISGPTVYDRKTRKQTDILFSRRNKKQIYEGHRSVTVKDFLNTL